MPFSVRGKVLAWLRRPATWQRVVSASGLSERVSNEVATVVRRTRLWRREKADVARELCEHFADGLAAGRSENELIGAFGDRLAAAKLIRRAKKRQRGWLYHSWRRTWRSAAAALLVCVVLYGALAARYFMFRPQVRHNYSAEMNASILATPVEQRAWPVYVQSVREFGPLPELMYAAIGNDPRRPGDENWDLMVAYLDSHKEAMATLRRAAAMPNLGFIYRSTVDPDYSKALEIRNPDYK
jgi:hypothetical protein